MTVNVVCAECNNGWMARIEESVRPALHAMLHGHGRALHQVGQRNLATWALKTALMAQYTLGAGNLVFPREAYDHLNECRRPPATARIWMASYTGAHPGVLQVYGLDLDDSQDAHRDRRDVYGAMIGLGPVIFQIFGTTNPQLLEAPVGWRWRNVWEVWPYSGRSFTWAPSPAFADDALLAFADEIPASLVRLGQRARRAAGH
jgi:hypothetical protein